MNTASILLLPFLAPFLSALLIFAGCRPYARLRAVILALVSLLGVLFIATNESIQLTLSQNEFTLKWFPEIGLNFSLKGDYLSFLMVVLTSFLTLAAILLSEKLYSRSFYSAIFLLQGATTGCFLANDLLLFFIFFELMLIPIYFLASGALAVRDNVTLTLKEREEAATKFVIYTLAGSAPLFFAIVYLAKHIYNERGEVSFVLSELLTIAAMPIELELALFLLFAITFAVKLPLFPFHSWLSGLYRSLPLGVLVLVAGVVGKVGIYGLIRFAYPLFPSAAQLLAPGLAWLAAISIVYGALMALVSKRIREILAFASLSHLGYCVLGFASAVGEGGNLGLTAATFQMISHAISSALLFVTFGAVLERYQIERIGDVRGIADGNQVIALLAFVGLLAGIGLPLSSGFIGEFLVVRSALESYLPQASLALLGVILGAVYLLSLYRNLFFGEASPVFGEASSEKKRAEISLIQGEKLVAYPLVAAVFAFGIFPNLLLTSIDRSIDQLRSTVRVQAISNVAEYEDNEVENPHPDKLFPKQDDVVGVLTTVDTLERKLDMPIALFKKSARQEYGNFFEI